MRTRDIKFTSRQKEIIPLVKRGEGRKAIADRLKISPKTVDDHMEKIRRKLGATTSQQATYFLNR